MTQLIIDEDWNSKSRNEHQLELEKLFNKYQLLPRLREAYQNCTKLDFAALMSKHDIAHEFGFNLLAQMALHKRATVPTIIGSLRHHFSTLQETADELEKAVVAGLVTYDDDLERLIIVYDIGERLQAALEKFQYPLPMVVRPRTLKSNLDSGYLTGKGSVILKNNHHDNDVCLDHLNRANQIALSLNLEVAQTIQNKWKGLDKKAEDESWDDYKKRQKAFSKYDRVARDVINILLKEGNRIYLTHKYDKRGRAYCQGFHVTYQGTDWNKAIIEFADKELVAD